MIENIGQVHACLFCTKITYIQSSNTSSAGYVVLTSVPVYSLFFHPHVTLLFVDFLRFSATNQPKSPGQEA